MQPDKTPRVSIVIPAYNSAATLEDTLTSCLDQDYPKDGLEIIVVDDGSTDNTGKIVKELPIIYISKQKRTCFCQEQWMEKFKRRSHLFY